MSEIYSAVLHIIDLIEPAKPLAEAQTGWAFMMRRRETASFDFYIQFLLRYKLSDNSIPKKGA